MKTIFKRFLKWNPRHSDGFTLVELIVVIAILAILAAVAVPAYNGYIEKANRQADEVLIAAINKAAATATLEAKGVDMNRVYTLYEGKPNNGGALMSNALKGQTGITVEERFTQDGAVKEAFAVYFADNEDKCLKWYGSLKFDGEKFIGVESVLNGSLVVPEGSNVANAFDASNYKNLGVEGMTGMVDTLSGALANHPALANRFSKTAAFGKTLAKLGIDPKNATDQELANASVFFLADYLGEMNETEVWGCIADPEENGSLYEYLLNDTSLGFDDDDAEFFEVALNYAVATAYAYSDYASDDARKAMENANPKNKDDAMGLVGQMTADAKWFDYLSSPNNKDFDAFFEIMAVVDQNGDSFSTIAENDLFSNAELQAEINRILGITD